ncbi:hypothetical protein BDP27DRAFT_1418576 [Rhodocollybia butyracea]|uniref:Protein kinase domain-containing protein n=1 Tax=Rhodocollybia butyracea TaxID=206335 RepID=A0A9P5UAG7_9AGAR|nr:hypothetical protein BDP27DRAFT_1418576 [Rhodocollybia butyracea]
MYSANYILFILHILSIFTTASYARPTRKLNIQDLKEDLMAQPWIGPPYSDSNLEEEDKKVFEKTLQGVELGAKLPDRGLFNTGLYKLDKDYKNHKASEIVVKCMRQNDNKAWGEVKALKAVGYFIDSGMLLVAKNGQHKDSKPTPVILMRRIPGDIPPNTPLWTKGRTQLLHDIKAKAKEEVITWAVDKKVLVSDFNIENIHIVLTAEDTLESVFVLDFGWPGVYTVLTVDREKVAAWFDKQWKEFLPLTL